MSVLNVDDHLAGHSCKDPINCRHLCCKDGTKKPPVARKPKKKVKNPTFEDVPEEVDELLDNDPDILTIGSTAPTKPIERTKSMAMPAAPVQSNLDKILADIDAMEQAASSRLIKPSTANRSKSDIATRLPPAEDDFLPDPLAIPAVVEPVIPEEESRAMMEEEQAGLEDIGAFDGFPAADDLPSDLGYDLDMAAQDQIEDQDQEAQIMNSSPLGPYSPVVSKKRPLVASPIPNRSAAKKPKTVARAPLEASQAVLELTASKDTSDPSTPPPQNVGRAPKPPLFEPASSQTAVEDAAEHDMLLQPTQDPEQESMEDGAFDFLAWLDENVTIID